MVPQARVQGQQVEEQGQGSSAFLGFGGMWRRLVMSHEKVGGFFVGGVVGLFFFRIADEGVCCKGVVI